MKTTTKMVAVLESVANGQNTYFSMANQATFTALESRGLIENHKEEAKKLANDAGMDFYSEGWQQFYPYTLTDAGRKALGITTVAYTEE